VWCVAAQDGVAMGDTVPVAVGHGSLDSMQYIQNVIVYGRRPYEEVIPAQVLTGKQLEGLNSHSVADAIRYFSGVQTQGLWGYWWLENGGYPLDGYQSHGCIL